MKTEDALMTEGDISQKIRSLDTELKLMWALPIVVFLLHGFCLSRLTCLFSFAFLIFWNFIDDYIFHRFFFLIQFVSDRSSQVGELQRKILDAEQGKTIQRKKASCFQLCIIKNIVLAAKNTVSTRPRQVILSVGQVWVCVYSSKGQVNI